MGPCESWRYAEREMGPRASMFVFSDGGVALTSGYRDDHKDVAKHVAHSRGAHVRVLYTVRKKPK